MYGIVRWYAKMRQSQEAALEEFCKRLRFCYVAGAAEPVPVPCVASHEERITRSAEMPDDLDFVMPDVDFGSLATTTLHDMNAHSLQQPDADDAWRAPRASAAASAS